MNNRIEGREITKKYREFTLDGLDFEVPEGFITGFIGPNGSGKTTTMKIILGLVKPDTGSIFIDGSESSHSDIRKNKRFGVVMDEPFLARDWKMDDVDKAMRICYDNWDSSMFSKLLEDYRIGRTLKVRELSKGMKIKLMLAIALSHAADTLILDEPTGGLDPSMRDELTDILKDFVKNEKNTVLFSTHNTTDIQQVADFIIFIQDGELIYKGAKDEFMEEFLIVKGGEEDFREVPQDKLIGLKKTGFGAEAMIRRKDALEIPEGMMTEAPSIDQIMIFMRRER